MKIAHLVNKCFGLLITSTINRYFPRFASDTKKRVCVQRFLPHSRTLRIKIEMGDCRFSLTGGEPYRASVPAHPPYTSITPWTVSVLSLKPSSK